MQVSLLSASVSTPGVGGCHEWLVRMHIPVANLGARAMTLGCLTWSGVTDRLKKEQTERNFRNSCTELGCSIVQGASPAGVQMLCEPLHRLQSVSIGLHAEGVKTMYRHAVDGELPLMPGVRLPEGITEEKILCVLEQIHKAKQVKFQEALRGRDSCGE